jgi:predicted transcriptional regulator
MTKIDKQIKTLTDDNVKALIRALVAGQGEFTQADITKLLDWASDAVVNHGILQNLLAGDAMVKFLKNGEMAFQITEQGKTKAREILAAYHKKH